MKLILLGPPGAGKGTQAVRLAESLAVPHISTGDLFRQNIREGTQLGLQACGFIDRGQLVPDEITQAMVYERVAQPDCEKGYILDGFPRTMPQAVALEEVSPPDGVLDLTMNHDDLLNRLTGRRVCSGCKKVYHVSMDIGGTCECGSPLEQRTDDNPETLTRRLDAYREQTLPLTAYYEGRGILITINASQPIEDVTAEMLNAVEKLGAVSLA